jgi:hypothetical protein
MGFEEADYFVEEDQHTATQMEVKANKNSESIKPTRNLL